MDFRSVIMGVSFALMWSSAFSTARIIVAFAPPLMALSVRFILSAAIALILARLLGHKLRPDGGWSGLQIRAIILFGLCQNTLYLGMNFIAMQWIEASLAAIIASSMPLIVAGLAFVLHRNEKASWSSLFGIFLGMAGVVLIMGGRVQAGADLIGIILCLIGAFALATATLSIKNALPKGDSLLIVVGLQMVVGAISLGILSGIFESTSELHLSKNLILALLYQSLVPGLGATLIWFALVNRIGAIKASSYHFLNPILGVSMAAILLGEALSLNDVAGVAVITCGILIVQNSRLRAAK